MVGGGFFEGGGFGDAGEGGVVPAGGLEGLVDDDAGSERAGGIVDGDEGGRGFEAGEVAEAEEDGLIAFVAAGDEEKEEG